MNLKTIPLSSSHQELIKTFKCNNIVIEKYLKDLGACYELAKTYILVDADNQDMIGFFSLCADILVEEDESQLNKTITNHSPAIKIKMFAIDERYKQKRVWLGKDNITYAHILFSQCLMIAQNITKNHVGATFLIANATKEGYNLYKYVGNMEQADENDSYRIPIGNEDNETIPMWRALFDDEYASEL